MIDIRKARSEGEAHQLKLARIAELENELAALRTERKSISDSICVKTDEGEVPDNLAAHVALLMEQEYYPALEKLEMFSKQIAALRQRLEQAEKIIEPLAGMYRKGYCKADTEQNNILRAAAEWMAKK